MLRKILLKTLLCGYAIALQGQDIHFSQFWEPYAFTNPSLIGNFDGNLKLSGQYRNQWSQFNTPLVSGFGDATIKLMREKHYWAFGISFLRDQLSYLTYYQSRFLGSISFQKNFSSEFQAGIGFQGGTRVTSIDYTQLTFDRQWDPGSGQFLSSNPSFEPNAFQSVLTPFINVGLSANLYRGNILHTIDFSTMYLAENSLKDFVFYQPIVIHANYHNYIKLGSHMTLMPKIGTIFTASANSFNTGLLVKYNLSETSDIYGGMLYRWGLDRNPDALIPAMGVRLNGLRIGISYDNTTSGINQESKKNAYEFFLSYVIKFPTNKYFSIDCMRL